MANNVIEFTSLIEKADAILSQHTNNLMAGAKALDTFVNSAKLPSSYTETLRGYEKANAEIAKTNKQVLATEKKLQRQRISDLKLQKKREQAFDKYEKQLQREAKALDRTTGLYNKVQAGINSLSKQYNDLALRKELGGKLTDEEIIQLGRLEAKLEKYQSALNKVDANVGKHQRNVGNYKSGYDGLGMSIAQLSREMPAFVNSVQTGFMAISNNIPMLFDEITRLKQVNVELASSGKPTVNILKRVGKAIFSLNGLLGIGITILTVFGPKLIEWATGMSESEKATKKATEELEEQNKALKENLDLRKRALEQTKSFINDTQISQQFSAIFKNVEGDVVKSEAALTELSDRLNKIGAKDYDLLTNLDITQSDRVVIAVNLLEIENQKIKLEEERLRLNNTLNEKKKIQEQLDNGEISREVYKLKMLNLGNDSLNESISIQTRIGELQEANNILAKKGVELKQDTGKSNKRAKETSVIYKEQITTIEDLTKALTELRNEKLKGSKEEKAIQDQIDSLNGLVETYNFTLDKSYQKKLSDAEASIKQKEELEKLQQATDNFLKSISLSSLGQLGMGSLTTFFDGTFDKLYEGAEGLEEKFAVTFTAISEVAKEAFSLINSFSQENFNQQYERLDKQKEFAIQFAGESATAKAEIDRQYELKRKQIQRKQAKAEKEAALFSAAINMAQGIVATIGQSGFPAAIPLIAAIGVIGAANIALIQSQQIPEFKDGVENFGGGLAKVNDAKGSKYKELIKTPDGKLSMAKGRNSIVDLPKGTDVLSANDTESFIKNLYKELSLNDIMPFSTSIGRSAIPRITEKGITKDDLKEVFSNEVDRLNNTIKSQPIPDLALEDGELKKYITKNNKRVRVLNARVRGISRNV